MVLGLFGYYPWHYGAWDFFLDLGFENLGLSWIHCDIYLIILSGAIEVYLKTLGYLFVLCAGYRDYTLCL